MHDSFELFKVINLKLEFTLNGLLFMRLDIGCGKPEQKKNGYLGIDVNPDYMPDILYDCNLGLPHIDKSIDAINMDNSLEHFWNPVFILQECKRILKNGGIIEIILPNCQFLPFLIVGWFTDILSFWNWWMNRSFKKERSIHYTLWTKETANLLLNSLGFEICDSFVGNFTILFGHFRADEVALVFYC